MITEIIVTIIGKAVGMAGMIQHIIRPRRVKWKPNKYIQDTRRDSNGSMEDMLNVASAKVYITDNSNSKVTTEDEVLLMSDGDIPELPTGDITLNYDNGNISFTGDGYIKSGSVLLQAIYGDGGKLVEIIPYSVTGISDVIPVKSDFTEGKCKFMLWNSIEKMQPLADSIER